MTGDEPMADRYRAEATYQAKASASGHGYALTSQRDMTNQNITIKDSVVFLTQRVEETQDRAQHVEKLLEEIDELKARLAFMSEMAKSTEARLAQEAERARAAGRAQALGEAQTQLRDAERRRREIEARLDQVQDERDQAARLMRQAQLQALNARNELEEVRRAAQLEANLERARLLIKDAADAGIPAREGVYEDQLAHADAELGDFREQLVQLSAELKQSAEQEDPSRHKPWESAPSQTTYNLDHAPGYATSNAVSAAPPALSPLRELPPAARDRFPTGAEPPPPPLALLPHSRAVGAALFLLGLALFTVAGTYINIMLHAAVGPAVVWQIVFTCAAILVASVCTVIMIEAMDDSEMYIGAVFLLALPVLIATIFFPSRDLPGIGLAAHWLVYHLGPM